MSNMKHLQRVRFAQIVEAIVEKKLRDYKPELIIDTDPAGLLTSLVRPLMQAIIELDPETRDIIHHEVSLGIQRTPWVTTKWATSA